MNAHVRLQTSASDKIFPTLVTSKRFFTRMGHSMIPQTDAATHRQAANFTNIFAARVTRMLAVVVTQFCGLVAKSLIANFALWKCRTVLGIVFLSVHSNVAFAEKRLIANITVVRNSFVGYFDVSDVRLFVVVSLATLLALIDPFSMHFIFVILQTGVGLVYHVAFVTLVSFCG